MASIKTSIQLFDSATPTLRAMSNALNVCINAFESLNQTSGRGIDTTSLRTAQAELNKVELGVNEIEDSIELAKKQQDLFNNSIDKGANKTKGLGKGFLKIASVIGGAIGINQIMQMSDEMVSISARLQMIAKDGEKVEEIQEKIFASAQRSRGSYNDTADAIGKMGIMAKDSFSSTDELVAFMEQINKQFVIAGTAPEGIKAGMLQLTQAMASGVLRGEELNSVFEQAPTIIQSIAKYMGKPIGEIRNLAKEGKITADIVKNAMFYTAKETDERFNNMPKTFGQIKTAMANEAQKAFQPVLQQINKLMNNEKFMNFATNIMSAMSKIASFTTTAFNSLIGLANIVADNWDVLAPIIGAVTTALLLYKTAVVLATAKTWLLNIATGVKTVMDALSAGATMKQALAQVFSNKTILASPITWYILLVIALIAVIMALCAWIAKATGIAESAFGVITGSFMGMLALSANMVIGFINGVIQALNFLISPFVSIVEWIVNAFNGGFDNIGDALLNLLGKMINHFLSFAKIITPIIDAVFGTEWTKKIDNLKTNINNWGKNDKAKTYKVEIPTLDRFKYEDAFKVGADWGDGITKKVKNLFTPDTDELDKLKKETEAINSNFDPSQFLTDINSNTDAINNLNGTMDWLDEDLKYMNDIAEREAINRYTTAEIKVDLTNNNSINSKVDVDDFMTKFNENLIEVLQTASEGVH